MLGISKTANSETIKKAYRKLALKFHPDVCNLTDAQGRFIEVQEAYEILSDITKRHYYDILWDSHYQIKERTKSQEIFEKKIRKDYQQWKYDAHKSAVELAKEKFGKVKDTILEGVGKTFNFISTIYAAAILIIPFGGIFVNWTDYKNGNEASLTGVIICSIISALILFCGVFYIKRKS